MDVEATQALMNTARAFEHVAKATEITERIQPITDDEAQQTLLLGECAYASPVIGKTIMNGGRRAFAAFHLRAAQALLSRSS